MTATEPDLSPKTLRRAAQFLSRVDEDWARHVEAVGPCRLEPKPTREPYEALVRAIAYQQLHAKAGDAILGRWLELYSGATFPSAEQILATKEEKLRACGFSTAKVATIRGIAQATLDGIVPTLAEARNVSDEALIDRLTTLRGVGRWTVEMLLIYSLERPDILPIGDFGVREGYRRLKRLDETPTPRRMRDLGAAWSPYRTVAAWYLWRLPASGARR
ncbi:DNA-3-methyladenine glycosylase II [Labilithrix luteola]|uniref:DNA-3-methyladenine glycosylase II n=1 Tax=Labilithrix luteola TaxID=1391654 RepID=A0A0K1PWL2_9BACT|nr:DNA-3-methyladenine glycosylase [Labilithrix luteola]AKU97920.1 DNA-3-methyladenine glycosylase II [Labilithrix luteola]